MIDPAAIPQIPGDMAAPSAHATTVAGVGISFPDTGRRVNSTWQGLAAVYGAPDAAELFAATGPVQSVSASVGEDISAAGGAALNTYANDVTAIKARLEALRAQATTFVDTITAEDDWRDDEGDVEHHNQLVSDVNAAVADFMDAQRRCANTILALYTDQRYTAENGDGTITEHEYGYTTDQLDAVMAEDGALPWGTAEEHDRGVLGDVGAFFVGIKDGAVGMVVGLGGLIGYADGQWSWGNAGTAWAGLGTFALALGVYSTPLGTIADRTVGVPGFEKGELGGTLVNAGKAIIAYDTWGEDKSKAAGMATFNVVSAIVGTKGAGSGLRGGGAAVQGSRFATVATVGAGMVRVGEFLGRLPTVESVIGNAGLRIPGLRVPHIDIPDVDIPPTRTDAPPALVGAPHVETHGRVADAPGVGDGVARASDTPQVDLPGARVDVEVPNSRVDPTPPHGATPEGNGQEGKGPEGKGPEGNTPDNPGNTDPDGPASDGDAPDQTPDGPADGAGRPLTTGTGPPRAPRTQGCRVCPTCWYATSRCPPRSSTRTTAARTTPTIRTAPSTPTRWSTCRRSSSPSTASW